MNIKGRHHNDLLIKSAKIIILKLFYFETKTICQPITFQNEKKKKTKKTVDTRRWARRGALGLTSKSGK